MEWNSLKANWALLIAGILGLVVLLIIAAQLIRRSAWGQLRETCRTLTRARRQEAKALKAVDKAERTARRLHEQADKTKPRYLQEAKETLEDARALAKIANDKVLIAENHVRRVIHEEYPPVKQEILRGKYLPKSKSDHKPFSF